MSIRNTVKDCKWANEARTCTNSEVSTGLKTEPIMCLGKACPGFGQKQ